MPTPEQALQFAVMVHHGYPSTDAIQYFFPELAVAKDMEGLLAAHHAWVHDPEVHKAIKTVQGKAWHEMSLEEQVEFALNKHYAELAYLLYSHNYAGDNSPADRQKMDVARAALEAKKAGSSGKLDPLMQWFSDIKAGKVTIASAQGKGTPAVSH